MTELIRYDAACRAIAEAHSLDEAKEIRDKAAALQAYARQAHNSELEHMVAEIRLRAKRRIGEMSRELEKVQGERTDVTSSRPGDEVGKREALASAGISKSEAHRCEKIAAVPAEEFEGYVAKCRDSGKTVSSDELAKRVTKKVSRAEKIETIKIKAAPLPEQRQYNVLYADPPWQYRNVVSEDRRLENHYPTMTLDEICALPISGLAADDAVLFLWATVTELPGALRVMDAWGFEYRSHAVWVKPSIGIGFWFRAQHELLLLGVRGKIPTPIESARHSSVFQEPTGKHSEKPAAVREMIDLAYGDLPRIELFARAAPNGWDTWGLEA